MIPLRLNNDAVCSVEMTFGELRQKAGAFHGMGGEDDESHEAKVLPDIWIKKWDPGRNSVTTTGQWWEHQDDSLRISNVLQAAPGGPADISQNELSVWIVSKTGDYVIALVNDNGREFAKVVGMCISCQVWYEPAHYYI